MSPKLILQRKKEQEIEKYKYQLSNDYYQLLVLEEQRKLMEGNIDLLNIQISLEKTRKDLDLTTNLSISNLENQMNSLLIGLERLDNSIEQSMEVLKTDLNMGTEEELVLNLVFGDAVRLSH